MKILQMSALRAIIVLVIGFLLVKYREETMTWMTITIGVLFFLSGLVACLAYYFEKERIARRATKTEELVTLDKSPSFPFAGVGSIVLGIILAVMPGTFITWVVYILAALLILGAVSQFMNLARSRQYARVPIVYWIFPSAILVVAILVISKPIEAASLPLQIIGWTLMCYGIIELIMLVRLLRVRRKFEKAEEAKIITGKKIEDDGIEDAEIIDE
ncbi:MAG: DUF308 domain-containing protein [Prevotella sp.]|nr:DUF308 domain-containing protein [Prevotella sp.]